MASKPVLGYWNIRALGHPVRFLLKYLEVDFEEKQYEYTKELAPDNWLADKEKLNLPFPNIPYFIDGSHRITESRAIMKYLCRKQKPEMLGKTTEEQTRVDMVDYFIYDLVYSGLIPVVFFFTEEKNKTFKEEQLPQKLRYLTDFIKNHKWITGDEITYVDFNVYEVLYQISVYDSASLDKFTALKEYMRRFEELPAIKAYMASPEFIKRPVYGDGAIIQM